MHVYALIHHRSHLDADCTALVEDWVSNIAAERDDYDIGPLLSKLPLLARAVAFSHFKSSMIPVYFTAHIHKDAFPVPPACGYDMSTTMSNIIVLYYAPREFVAASCLSYTAW